MTASPSKGRNWPFSPPEPGGDFRRSLELLSQDLDRAVEGLLEGQTKPLDLGLLSAVDFSGHPTQKLFVNIASFGLGGLVDQVVNRGPKWLGGRAAFALGTLRALLAYRDAAVRVRVDGQDFLEDRIINVAVANGRYFGGGMMIAPQAELDDGELDVVALTMTRLQSVALTRAIYNGTHLRRPGVFHTRGRTIEAEPVSDRDEILIDLDGETPGKLPLTIKVLPGALQLRGWRN